MLIQSMPVMKAVVIFVLRPYHLRVLLLKLKLTCIRSDENTRTEHWTLKFSVEQFLT